ncbi:endonuclease NucS domain-containing protein [Halalkalicoccus subterraneus]|uniref:endonuclease NucS domain-containing protein n=1 Tax=Halalkalicoccus subterraneus TaxID=2675002 RepID=UPI000EFAE164|nr:endonuclease NucS domain-containing protein [Halalkalicoccus subterraneus]
MPAPDSLQVLAGECLVHTDEVTHRGEVVILLKPDNTVLVHDTDGYQPVAWLTRADSVASTRNGGFSVTAIAGEKTLRVESESAYGFGEYPGSAAGIPIGDCPDCERALVRAGGVVSCLGCENRFGLPDGASVLDERCECGLPKMTVARGERFELCLSRGCGSLDSAVKERFDREWDCPECDGSLRVIRRGGLLAGCENYPDCETGYVIPDGVAVGECDCGLPRFETPRGTRCLDSACDRDR